MQVERISQQTLMARTLAGIHAAYVTPSQFAPSARERAAVQFASLQQLVSEAQRDFARSMNKVIFDGTVDAMREARQTGADPAAAAAAAFGASAGGVPTDLAVLATVDVPPPAPRRAPPARGLVPIPQHPFKQNAEAFAFITLFSRMEILQVFQRAATENTKIFAKGGATAGFLVGNPGKPLKLDEFEATQAAATHTPLRLLLLLRLLLHLLLRRGRHALDARRRRGRGRSHQHRRG